MPLDNALRGDIDPEILADVHGGQYACYHRLMSVGGRYEPSRRHKHAAFVSVDDEIPQWEFPLPICPVPYPSGRGRPQRQFGTDAANAPRRKHDRPSLRLRLLRA